ncbi:variant erythrocyte surface antigen-1 family protein [Babesia caballi]|uniref:Variant erythrocyte surface antigen-1 family protein n=1 Tax=Babesia caballi TaxID=5871 RepID=A0AAV4LVA0_BABCB|nr:variant erythrocyte surface antigen-1 family protein [Babesia caballi]
MGNPYSKLGSNGPFTCLTQQPRNLKEGIDWVLRFSGRDTQNYGQHGEAEIGAGAITKLADAIIGVLKKADCDTLKEFKEKMKNCSMLAEAYYNSLKTEHCLTVILQNLITSLTESLSTFIGYDNKWEGTITGKGIAIGREGPGSKGESIEPSKPWKSDTENEKKEIGYVLAYNPDKAKWDGTLQKNTSYAKTCADNFFTAVIIIFEGLTYLYWGCRINENAPWRMQQFKGAHGDRLYAYLLKQGFKNEYLNNHYIQPIVKKKHVEVTDNQRCREGAIINGILSRAFYEFGKAMAEISRNPNSSLEAAKCSYDDFIAALIKYAKDGLESFKNSATTQHSSNLCPISCAQNGCDGGRRMAAFSTFMDYPLTKLYVFALAYKCFTDKRHKSAVFKAMGGVTCGAGIGAAAYYTNVFGFGPMIAGLFT